jgi:arginase
MGPLVLEFPQWQGSSFGEPRRLVGGSAALAAHVPPGADRVRVAVSDEPGMPGLVANLAAARAALSGLGDRPTVTLGGECGIEVAPVEAAISRYGENLAVVWFDAHGDLNTEESSPSGAFHGMALRALLGEGPARLRPEVTLDVERVVLVGVRSLDDPEREFIDKRGVRLVPVADLADPAVLVAAVEQTGAEAVYVHLDLDVLEPSAFGGLGFPEPGGLLPEAVAAAVGALAARFRIVGLAITEYYPLPEEQGSDAVGREVLATLVPDLLRVVS